MKHSTSEKSSRSLVEGSGYPIDTLIVGVSTLVAAVVVLFASSVPLKVVLGLPFVLFIPGYCLLLVLYPGQPESGGLVRDRGISGIERAALSVGASLLLLPLLGLVVWVVAAEFETVAVVGVVVTATLALAAVGELRRFRLPADQRYRLRVREWGGRLRAALTAGGTSGVLNIVLVLAVVATLVTATYVAAVPTGGETYTGFQLLTDDGDAEYVAGEYPTDLTAGESASLVAGVENHESETVSYTVVVELQRVTTEDGSTSVESVSELSRLETTVEDDETAYLEHSVTPTTTGDDLRLRYYLYRGDAPANPSDETAYRTLSLWITVDDAEDEQAASTAG